MIQIFFHIPVFKNTNLKIQINNQILKEKFQRKGESYNQKIKNERTRIDYKIGDSIYVKNINPDKVEPKWRRPFIIKKISLRKNNIHIDYNNKISRISIKNCRSFRRGGDVMNKVSSLKEDVAIGTVNLGKTTERVFSN